MKPPRLLHGLRREVADCLHEPRLDQLACGGARANGQAPFRVRDHLGERTLGDALSAAHGSSGVSLLTRDRVGTQVHPQLPRITALSHETLHGISNQYIGTPLATRCGTGKSHPEEWL